MIDSEQKVSVRPVTVRSQKRYCVDYNENGKRKRSFWPTEAKAQAEAVRLRSGATTIAQQWDALSVDEQRALLGAYRIARERNLDLFALANSTPAAQLTHRVSIAQAISDLLSAKRSVGRKARYLANLERHLLQFAAFLGDTTPLAAISLRDVEHWLNSKPPGSRTTLRAQLSTLFNFGLKRDFCPQDPCSKLESAGKRFVTPHTLSLDQIQRIITTAEANPKLAAGLPWFFLSLGCGLRPEEAEHLTLDQINFNDGSIRINPGLGSKTGHRLLYPRPEALTALRFALTKGQLPTGHATAKYFREHLRSILGLKSWPRDCTRHTAASAWLAIIRDTGSGSLSDLAESLGNSPEVIKAHYDARMPRDQARAFWLLLASLQPTPSILNSNAA